MKLSKKEFIQQNLTNDPKESGLEIGELVKWTNDYGVEWEHRVIGFNYDDDMAKYGNTVYLDKDAYWFPINPKNITKLK